MRTPDRAQRWANNIVNLAMFCAVIILIYGAYQQGGNDREALFNKRLGNAARDNTTITIPSAAGRPTTLRVRVSG